MPNLRICTECPNPVPKGSKSLNCSDECRRKRKLRVGNEPRRMLRAKKKGKEYVRFRTCSECGTQYDDHTRAYTCSDKCLRNRRNRLGREQLKRKTCIECGRKTGRSKYLQTCGVKCEEKREMRIGLQTRLRYKHLTAIGEGVSQKVEECVVCGDSLDSTDNLIVCSDRCQRKRKKYTDRVKGYHIQLDEIHNYAQSTMRGKPRPKRPDPSKFPADIPEDSKWLATNNLTIGREWVKYPAGRWRTILEEMATATKAKVKEYEYRRKSHKRRRVRAA